MTLWWGTQNCAKHLKCSLISAKYIGTITYPVGRMVSEASWDTINQLGHLGTELAQVQPTCRPTFPGPFSLGTFQLLYPKPKCSCCDPSTEPSTELWWMPCGWTWPINPAYTAPSAKPTHHQDYHQFHLTWYLLQYACHWRDTRTHAPLFCKVFIWKM